MLTFVLPVNFRIDLLRDIEWNANAFESLSLPGNYKDLLLAFAQTQGDEAAQFDDVIEGKGLFWAEFSVSSITDRCTRYGYRQRNGRVARGPSWSWENPHG